MSRKGAEHRKQQGNTDHLTLIDTSAWILALRRESSSLARSEIDRLIEKDLAATAGIVKLELLCGARTTGEYKELKEDLEALVQLEITQETWDRASHLAYSLRRKGLTLPSADVLIVAVASENGCNLIHADHHFDLIAEQNLGLSPAEVVSLL